MFPRYEGWQTKCFVILDHFLPFHPKNQYFEKTEKNARRYYHFTQVYQKSWSYAILFLRYAAWQMYLFFILGYFLPFYPHNSPKNGNVKKRKKHLEILSFYASVPKIRVIRYTIPETWRVTDVIVIFHFGLFFPLLPP